MIGRTNTRFFYGWIMLGVAVLMGAATMPSQSVLLMLYNDSIRQALGVSIIQLSTAFTIGTILASLPLPLVGHIADRIGVRLTVGMISLGLSASLVLLGRATGIVTLGVCYFFIRFLGQGALAMLANHVIANWFERKLGVAHSLLAVLGFALTPAVFTQPVAWMIEVHGWRSALLASAIGVFVFTFPAVVLIFRSKPGDVGQHLDGDPVGHDAPDTPHGGSPPIDEEGFTVMQAFRTPVYWFIAATMFYTGFLGTALLFHLAPMLREAGLEGTERQSGVVIQPWPIAFGVMILVSGWLVDRYRPALLFPWALVAKFVTLGLFAVATTGWVSPDTALVLGAIGLGFFGVSQAVVFGVGNPTVTRFFGRAHHGAIRGTVQRLTVLGTGVAPLAVTLLYKIVGEDYTPVLVILLLITVPLGVAGAMLRRPTPPRPTDTAPAPAEPDAPPS